VFLETLSLSIYEGIIAKMHPSRQAYVEEAESEVSKIPHLEPSKLADSIHMILEGRRAMILLQQRVIMKLIGMVQLPGNRY
jgi:hypothetical protein